MVQRHVFIPARLPEGLGGPAEIRDADDWPHRFQPEYVTLVESRPCVTAELLGELRGRYHVRLPGGRETWVEPTPDVWAHEPEPEDRVSFERGRFAFLPAGQA